MAVAAQKLLAGPEDNVGELRTLLTLGTNDDPQASERWNRGVGLGLSSCPEAAGRVCRCYPCCGL